MRKILLYFSLKYQGDYQKIYQAIKQKEKVSPEDLNHIEQKIQSQYVTLIVKHTLNPLNTFQILLGFCIIMAIYLCFAIL